MRTVLPVHLAQTKSLARSTTLVAGVAFLTLLGIGLALAPSGLAAAGLGAVLVATGVLRSPVVGLVLIALLLPWGRFLPLPLPAIGLVDGLVALTVFAWLLRGLAVRRIVFRSPPLMWPLLASVWIAGLSLIQAESWREGVPEWLKWGEFAAVYLLAAQVIDRRNRSVLIAALFLAGMAQAAIGAYQFLGQVGPDAFVLSGRFMRAYGTFEQPNPYAGYLGYLAPMAVSLGLAAGKRWWAGRQPRDLALAAACAFAAAALLGGIMMSWSRGAWMGLAAALAIVIGLHSRHTAAAAIGGALLVLLLLSLAGTGWLPESLTARIGGLSAYVGSSNMAGAEITDANFSVLERLAHWQAGLQMFADNPWLGVGIGNYAEAYPVYAPAHWYTALGHAHNVFINFLAETGAIGLLGFGIFWLGIGYWTFRRSRYPGPCRAIALGILGAWAYLTVHSLFDNLFVQHIQLQLALLLGILAAEDQYRRERTLPRPGYTRGHIA